MALDGKIPNETYNMDIVTIVRYLDRFVFEVWKSVSSGFSDTTDHDITRLNEYLARIRGYHAFCMSLPLLDLPDSSPCLYELQEPHDTSTCENEALDQMIRVLQRGRLELVASQSSRRSNGLQSHDSARLMAVVERAQNLLDEYIIPLQPTDLPESTPHRDVTGHGRTGVSTGS
jgi:hypothetical protein